LHHRIIYLYAPTASIEIAQTQWISEKKYLYKITFACVSGFIFLTTCEITMRFLYIF